MSCGWVELVLVRHGTTPGNEERRYQGRSEVSLSGDGRRQARELGQMIGADLGPDAPVWCSPLRRGRETARLAFPDRELRTDPRLAELDLGELEGLTHTEAEERLGDRYLDWIREPETGAPPGGEPLPALRERVTDWLRGLARQERHVAVTHLGPIQVLTSLVLDLPLARTRRLKIEPGDWTRLLVPADHSVLRREGTRGAERPSDGAGERSPGADPGRGVDPGIEVRELAAAVTAPSGPERSRMRTRLDGLAKPPGSLGRLEEIAVRLARVLGDPPPPLERRLLPVFLADHGVAGRGVSAYPPDVTAAMARIFSRGGAASQALASACGVTVVPVDVGVDADRRDWENVVSARVRRGTRDLGQGPALTREEAARAMAEGARTVRRELGRATGAACVALGEMGIGNTTAASAVGAALTGRPAAEMVGPGTGVEGDALQRKRRIVRQAVSRLPDEASPLEILAEVGGLEIAAISGGCLEAARRGRPVLVDGFISSAAALAAVRLAPAAGDYLFAAHRSAEPGHRLLLDELGLEPVLDLDLRLGEGTGAVLAAPILDAAGALLRDTATLEEATGATGGD